MPRISFPKPKRPLTAAAIALLFATITLPSAPAEADTVKVLDVIDGSTIVVEFDGKIKELRYIGVHAPKPKRRTQGAEYYGKEAFEFNAELVSGQTVRLEFDVQERDERGHLLAYVYLPDGTFVNAKLVEEGYAQVATNPPNVKHRDLLLQLQRQAKENNKGLWGKEVPTGKFVASRRYKTFHKPDCENVDRISPADMIVFDSKGKAVRSGRNPCRKCLGQPAVAGTTPRTRPGDKSSSGEKKSARPGARTVYVSRVGGIYYHLQSCGDYRKDMVAIPQKNARAFGYIPCGVCRP